VGIRGQARQIPVRRPARGQPRPRVLAARQAVVRKVPAIVEAMLALPVKSATIDGEGVVCDDWGVTDFERLRFALAGRGGSRTVFLYAFDLIELNGTDLRPQPWIGRREALASVLTKASNGIVLSEYVVGAPGGGVGGHRLQAELIGRTARAGAPIG
jgi:ATP dependent DNA ligase-like protein